MTITIFDRYMAMRFLKPFLFGLGIFALLVFLGDMFDKMPRLVRSPANLLVILQYLWLDVPYWTVRVIPMATLLAALFAVSGFAQSGEWIAVQASGFETGPFFRPILLMAALVTVASFAAQETILPVCFSRSQRLWRERIDPSWEYDQFQDKILVGRPGQFVTPHMFWISKELMVRPVMDYYEDGRVVREIAARQAKWDRTASRWVFLDGAERNFGSDGRMTEKSFAALVSDLDTPPRNLAPRNKNPDEMSIIETLRYMRQIHHLGGSMREARAALHSKIAYPFSNFILCALGIPIALGLRRRNKILSFGLAMSVSFAYLWMLEVGRALGNSDLIHPALAAWIPNGIFGGLAFWLNRNSEK